MIRASKSVAVVVALAGSALGQVQWLAGAEAVATEIDAARVVSAARDAGESHILVTVDATAPGAREQLAAAGVTLLSFLGDSTYFAAVRTGSDPAALDAFAAPLHVARIRTQWKLHPDLTTGIVPTWAVVPPPSSDVEPEPWIAAYVMFHPDVPPAVLDSVTREAGAKVISPLRSVNGLVLEMPLSSATQLASNDAVMYLEPALPPLMESNDSNRNISQANIVQAPPYGLSGAGVSVMVYDGGFAFASHVDFQGRLTVRDTSGLSTHATHVSGTIGGAGVANPTFRGMAPGVTIQSYGFEQAGGLRQGFLYTDPGDLEADYSNAINVHGADIANNSIGTNTAPNGFPCSWEGDYGVTSALIDSIVRGSLGSPFRIVFANGNERSSGRCGTTYHTTAPPACAKNHITVGALNSNDDSVTFFTSWGPTDDGRLKPDISASGCQVGGDAGVTSCSATTTGYTTFCGTSMACPTVVGLSSLLLEDFRTRYPARPDPRNSTLKALLAHNAQDIDSPGPDYKSGYGSVRIQRTVDFLRGGGFEEASVNHAGVHRSTIVVIAGAPELKVTLAWDDPPAAPNVVGTIINDLDIVVLDPSGVQHFPWTLGGLANPAAPAVRTLPDRVNNIEQVFVAAPTPGVWTVEIRGFNVPVGPQIFSACYSPGSVGDCNANGVNDLDDIAFGTSQDCNLNSVPDECEAAADCNANGVRDFCDLFNGTSMDVNGNRIPDECEPDCNNNDIPDAWDISRGTSHDCNANAVPDECDLSGGTSQDCNANTIPDECETDCNNNDVPDFCDIRDGTSGDCNLNGLPDECESPTDCNNNGVRDFCDLIRGTSADVNGNQIPDECEPDCNGNHIPDAWDISRGTSRDCNANAAPDECDLVAGSSLDCNANTFPDECDLAAGRSQDCNGNDAPDECDLAAGTSQDCNANAVPDDCDVAAGTSADCNANSVPDECDTASGGGSIDCNNNDVPDECENDCNLNGIADACDIASGFSRDDNNDGFPDECDTLYVKDDASGDNSGASWEHAFTTLDAALAAADDNHGVAQIWLAGGTYVPEASGTFAIRPGLALLGGFAGTEDAPGQRVPGANTTTLSGILNAGRAVHVVTLQNIVATTVLDGLTISGGVANGQSGAGILIQGGSPTIARCTISANFASSGAGAALVGAAATFVDCTFSSNSASAGDGGGIRTSGPGALTLTRCRFVSNSSREINPGFGRGAGVFNDVGSTLTVFGCTFEANSAVATSQLRSPAGGGIANFAPGAIVRNSTFLRNTSSAGGGIYSAVPMSIINCVFTGNRAFDHDEDPAGEGGGVFGNEGVDLALDSCTLAGNWAAKKAGGASLDGSIENSIIWHNITAIAHPDPLDYQLQGNWSIDYSNVASLLGGGGPDPDFPGSIESLPRFVLAPIMTSAGAFTPGDLHLAVNSPCVDSGNNTLLPPGTSTDIEGNGRLFDEPAAPNIGIGTPPVDMGAYERQPPPCPGDVNGDRRVDLADLSTLLANFGRTSGATRGMGDLDGDGDVDLSDLSTLLSAFGQTC
jgi:Subtilase family